MKSLDKLMHQEPGMYFVTICSKEKEASLGSIQGGKFFYTPLGKVATVALRDINLRFPAVIVESAVIMPNHIHLVISVYEGNTVKLGDIIRSYKSLVTRRYRRSLEKEGKSLNGKRIWQRSYDEQIIRNSLEQDIIHEYMENNIEKWSLDQYYTG